MFFSGSRRAWPGEGRTCRAKSAFLVPHAISSRTGRLHGARRPNSCIGVPRCVHRTAVYNKPCMSPGPPGRPLAAVPWPPPILIHFTNEAPPIQRGAGMTFPVTVHPANGQFEATLVGAPDV